VATAWEYLRVVAHGSTREKGLTRSEMARQTSAKWETLINERGAEGWELVSEHIAGEDWASGAWMEITGTMKRPNLSR
jgi:hypothetical protein